MPVVIRENMRETVDIRAVYKLGYLLETPIESCATHRDQVMSVHLKVRKVLMKESR